MIRIILLFSFLIALSAPAIAKDERGLTVRPTAPTGEKAKGELWLLTIGIDSYLSWPRLKTAVNDAKAVKDVLLKRYHLDPAHVTELTDDKATRHNILGAFRDLAKKVKPEDSLFVYYAGHGHIDSITGKGSWIPVESGTDDPTAWIDNRSITDYLNVNAIKARHILMVSDSCFSGDFFRGNRGNLPIIDDAFFKKAYTRSSRQAISSGGLEPVSDAGFGGNSVFSHFLVAALDNNSKPYLVPTELFIEVRAGVSKNADQLPQFGDLHGVGGQEGGELILFLKGDNRLQDISGSSVVRQKELEQLKKAEQETAVAKQKEQAEIAKKQAELDVLDKQIAEMKGRLGSGAAKSGDGMDQLLALAEQKEQQGLRLEELRRQREAEEQKRQQDIERLKSEAAEKRRSQIEADLTKFKKIAANKYAQDMKATAWSTLLANYPEARGVPQYNENALRKAVGLGPKGFTDAITGMPFIAVEGGCFQMGDTFGDGKTDEKPAHEVCLPDYTMATFDVTVGQFRRFTEAAGYRTEAEKGDGCYVFNGKKWSAQAGTSWQNPGFPQDDRHPAVCVSWNDAQAFAGWMSTLGSRQYRLPTEAEWEYAARSGGKKEKFAGFSDQNQLYRYANFCDVNCESSRKAAGQNDGYSHTSPVGNYQPNGIGLYDMAGNVWQWTADWYGDKYYGSSPKDNPQGPTSGSYRVLRGGSWAYEAVNTQAAFRGSNSPDNRGFNLGFRLVSPVQ